METECQQLAQGQTTWPPPVNNMVHACLVHQLSLQLRHKIRIFCSRRRYQNLVYLFAKNVYCRRHSNVRHDFFCFSFFQNFKSTIDADVAQLFTCQSFPVLFNSVCYGHNVVPLLFQVVYCSILRGQSRNCLLYTSRCV